MNNYVVKLNGHNQWSCPTCNRINTPTDFAIKNVNNDKRVHVSSCIGCNNRFELIIKNGLLEDIF